MNILLRYVYKSSEEFSEYSSHQPLEFGGCIAISHLHYLALKCAEYCRECRFPNILWSYVHLLISHCHIQLGSEFSSRYIMTYCISIWKRCHIFPCILVLLFPDRKWFSMYHFSLVTTALVLLVLWLLVHTTLQWCIA